MINFQVQSFLRSPPVYEYQEYYGYRYKGEVASENENLILSKCMHKNDRRIPIGCKIITLK